MSFSHSPVLYDAVFEILAVREGGVYFDGTLGGAGHACGIAERMGSAGTLIACDLDPAALRAAKERLSDLPGRHLLFADNFKNYEQILRGAGVESLSGALLDLGVSSPQLDDPRRGFSYQSDAPLDMRMSGSGPSAADLVNGASEQALRDILYRYGEEKNAPAIAAEIVRRREKKPIATTGELVACVRAAFQNRHTDKHPARRTFQALRIEVNDELSGLYEAIRGIALRLSPGGRLVVISFHSLEDRIVKRAFLSLIDGCTCPKEFPVCTCGFTPSLTLCVKHPVTASAQELAQNPRAHSAKLRAAQRL